MTNEPVKQVLKRAYDAKEPAPGFDDTWHAAVNRYRYGRRRIRRLAGVAAAIAAIAIVLHVVSREPSAVPFVDMSELLGSTSWQAPSDRLLPDRQIDLYEDLPALIESTEAAEGALL